MQYKSSSKSVKGYSLATVGFMLKMYLFFFLSKQMRKMLQSEVFYLFLFKAHILCIAEQLLELPKHQHSSAHLRLRDETRKGCGSAAALGEVGGSRRQWGRLQVIKFGVPLMVMAVKAVIPTVGKLTAAADAALSQPEPDCSCCSHPHGCLLCFPLPALRHTLSNTAKYYFLLFF